MEIKFIENPVSISTIQNTFIETDPTEKILKQPFVSAILYLREMLRKLLISIDQTQDISGTSSSLFQTDSSSLPDTRDVSFLLPGTMHFYFCLNELKHLKEEGLLLDMIKDCREEIHRQKEHWRPVVEQLKKENDPDFYRAIERTLKEGNLVANPSGCGSAYFAIDEQAATRFVVKPVDEDIFCLNNRKEFGSIFHDSEHRVRDDIPLYRSAQTDVFCWEVASLAGLEETTPRTVMGIINRDEFYDFTLQINTEEKENFILQTGMPDTEKLCSIQEFIPDSQDWVGLLQEFYSEGLSDEEIASRFDQNDFERVCMLLWLSYDTDAHGGNFRTYIKRTDENGKKIYGIKKIDNGLSFPEKNTQYTNILAWAPNALMPISAELKQKIDCIPVEQILNRMDRYELSDCKEAFKERIDILKELSQRKEITINEIDLRLSFLSRDGGKELALCSLTTQEIIDLLMETSTGMSPSSYSIGSYGTI
jgi:hypothetical protein